MSSTAAADIGPSAPAGPAPGLDRRKMFAFICMVFGMFMAILDIQIVSASLSEIQAGLSASSDEISWVQTSYLIAEVIMIPLSGYLSRAFSTRWMFAGSAAGFTFMSFMCATATSIDQMIVYRALQGFIGGGMIPTVFASAYSVFPREKQPVVAPIIGLVATLAPTIGPTVGGYLTELFSWHWLFLINVVPGIAVTILTIALVDFDEPDLSLLDRFDWWGLLFMASFLGSLEFVLEEGAANDWFDDELIRLFTVVTVAAAVGFFWRAFTAREPVVDLRAFANRNFATGSAFSFAMGIGLYGLTYLYPIYLAQVRDYSALMIGETMFVSGLAMFLTAPFAGRLSAKMDPRLMIALGFFGFGLGTWQAAHITSEWDFWELFVPQILRGVSLMFCMVPITNLSLGTLPLHELKNASGLFNVTRNLGGAVGLAVINTLLSNRTDLHAARLAESVAWGRQAVEEKIAAIEQGLSSLGPDAHRAAIAQIGGMVSQQSAVMAFADVFYAMTLLFFVLILATPLMRKPAPVPAGAGGH
ncbi:DHA2 family efflux MFS transporter permease subunit [Amorphus orientalis]|uniref:DHA2 family multidrug resistance protein n=1 Tax=Amorphus orientalis TaxID=649198 RepID=A0AAE3VN22_9HYPH|nr:DHA2 family efflux MFS transporter permease subunit [Amorphus orientalis]MDQ0315062.1 DHA2 family multidrug resistance protein [Amorphus orientalis]